MFQHLHRSIRYILTQPQPKPLTIPIRAQQPQRRACQHRAIQRLIPLPKLCPFLPHKAAPVLHLVQLLAHLRALHEYNPPCRMHRRQRIHHIAEIRRAAGAPGAGFG